MTTESDTIRQNGEESKLSARQVKFLPVLIGARTYTEACRKGRVSRDTLYTWLRQSEFRTELDRKRAEVAAHGLTLLCQNVTRAAQSLVDLLDSGDGRLKRLAAVNILDQWRKGKELDELVRRIEAIEERLQDRR